MRFCLECGNQLADAPFVVNLQNDTPPNQSNAGTDNFGQQFGNQSGQSGNQYVPPDYPTTAKSQKSNSKIFLAVGGVVALLLLLFMGVAAIVAYNIMSKETVNVTPTPAPTKSIEKDSPTPKSSATPQTSPNPSNRKSTLSDDTADDPNVTVQFDGVTVDYNIEENGQKGMLMKTTFSVTGMKDRDGYLAIHFQKRDGTPISAKGEQKYRDVNGNLAAFHEIKPDYDDTEYNNLELFLPYDELNLPVGKHDLKMDFDLLDGKGVQIEHLTYKDFWYEQK